MAFCAALMWEPQAMYGATIKPQLDAKKGQWGYVNNEGKWVVKPKYESAAAFTIMPDGNEASEVTHKGLTGYVDATGRLLGVGAVFESVTPLEGNAMLVKVKGKYGVADYSCKYIVKPELESVEKVDGNRMLVSKKGKQGLISPSGEYVVLPEYDKIDFSIPGFIRVTKGDKAGVLRAENAAVLMPPGEYNALEPFEQYWKATKGDKTGLVDLEHNRIVVKPDYDDVMLPLSMKGMTYIPVVKKGKWGVINGLGKEMLKFKYKDISPVSELNVMLLRHFDGSHGLWFPDEETTLEVVMDNAKTVGPFIIESGEITPPRANKPAQRRAYNRFDSGHYVVITDKEGKLVASDNVTVKPIGKYFTIAKGSRCDVYTASGKRLLTGVTTTPEESGKCLVFENELITPSDEVLTCRKAGGRIFVKQPDNLWHLMADGQISSEGYDSVTDGDGFIGVEKGGKWGVIHDGKLTIPCESPSPLLYDKDIMGFIITDNGKMGVRKLDGTVLVKPEYDKITGYGEGYDYEVQLNGKIGIVSSTDGSVVLTPEYDSYKVHGDANNMWVRKGDLYGVANSYGTIIIPVKYKDTDLHLLENRYYEAFEGGGKTTYYDSNGERLKEERRVTVTGQWLEHNVYDKNNNKCMKLHYGFSTQFLLEAPIYVEAKVYNANGKAAVNNRGQQIKYGWWATPNYLFANFGSDDRWISFPYAQFVQPRGSKRDYYVKLSFKYDNNAVIPTTGNEKLTFTLTR